jgi:hypothetical protein
MSTITTLAGTAGRITGTAAAGVIWVHRNTDWAEVGAVVLRGLQVAIVLTLLAGRYTRKAWDALPGLSEQLGRWYAERITPPDEVIDLTGLEWPMPIQLLPVPAYMPAAVPARVDARLSLESLTCAQLREITGIRRKLAKAQLIELALAA